MQQTLNELAQAAKDGSKDALEEVVRQVQGTVYNLAIRMLKSPADAEDATQEILIRLVTHLGQFRGESQFMTWVYRVASNVLINIARGDGRRSEVSFDDLSLRLEESLTAYEATPEEWHENAALTEEVKRSCTLGMLLCLDVEDRMALVLGEVYEVSSNEGAAIMGISSTAYRKRLSRARQQLVDFMSKQCGLINPDSVCRCHKHVGNKVRAGLLNPTQLTYVQPGLRSAANAPVRLDPDPLRRTIVVLRSHPEYAARTDFAHLLRRMLEQPDTAPDAY
ncbi:MAG: RNA polymerase sigma factor [Chloroflexota bacterium]|nr:RNA polymerase sigma factor [Chloroflexota bacterium]